MLMSWIWVVILLLSVVSAILSGRGSELSAAVGQGAENGIKLIISMAGSLCLWAGVGHLMEKTGVTKKMSQILKPVLGQIFPSANKDPVLAGSLSANICANFLGLGNAATPMGIQAAKRLANPAQNNVASDELCRLIVLNTASIQFIPTSVAAVRTSLGCTTPFDILPAVWVTSLCSAGLGVASAFLLGKIWKK